MVSKESWLVFEGPASICRVGGQVRKASAVPGKCSYRNALDKGVIFQCGGPWAKQDTQEEGPIVTDFCQSKAYTSIDGRNGKKKPVWGKKDSSSIH